MKRMLRLFLTLMAFTTIGDALAACGHADAYPKIGLVLGGGGARGAAHVGVLKVLERERIPVHCIAGTSMGAIVGSMYAIGYSPDEIEQVLVSLDWKDLFKDDPERRVLPMRRKDDDLELLIDFDVGLKDNKLILPRGAVQGQKMQSTLRRLLLPAWDQRDFDRLPIPFRAIATDIGRGERVVFEDGDLSLAVRASSSVPAAFAPIRVRGKLMVDGGITSNVPIDVVREMGADVVIAVNVSEPLSKEEELTSAIEISAQMITALMQRETDRQLATLGKDDVLIHPQLENFESSDFHRATDAIPTGIAAAENVIDYLRPLAIEAGAFQTHLAERGKLEFTPPMITFIDTVDTRSRTPRYVSQQLRDLIGKPFDLEELETHLAYVYADGRYQRITWKLREDNDQTGLRITPIDKEWGPNFVRFGLQLSDNFQGDTDYQLTAQATFSGLNSKGGEVRARVDLGRDAGLAGEWYQPFGDEGHYFASAKLGFLARDLPVAEDDLILRDEAVRIDLQAGRDLSHDSRFYGGLTFGQHDLHIKRGDAAAPGDAAFGAVLIGFQRDTLDDAEFPSQGSRLDAEHAWYREALSSDDDADVIRLAAAKAFSFGRHRLLLGTRFSSASQGEIPVETEAFLGGIANLSGYRERDLFGEQLALGRAVYYRRLGDESALFSVPYYLGASVEAGNVWGDRDDARLDSLIFAGSAFIGFDTFLGPVFLGFGHASTGENAAYLTFGSLVKPVL